jgi:hypothetical protein
MHESPNQASLEKIRALCRDLAKRRKLDEATRDELCGHLEDKLSGYLSGEVKITEEDALLLVKAHFGDAGEIASRLTNEKENVMSWWIWMGVVAAMLITVAILSPRMNDEAMGIWLGIVFGMAIQRFWQSDNSVSREIRAKSPWIFGPLAILFGPAMILPALAKIKQQHVPMVELLGPLLIGVIVLVTGIVLVGFGIRRRMRTA